MFERYTEKARRVIFFARYEAIQLGSNFIETEHLLLGFLRENQAFITRFLPNLRYDSIRKEIEERSIKAPSISPSVDLPLSDESKRVLAYAAEEAERLAHRHIGSEHLVLGLLREQRCYASQLLQRHGAHLDTLRLRLGSDQTQDVIVIHNAEYEPNYVESAVAECRRFVWQKKNFAAPDVVLRRSDGTISFDMSLAQDPTTYEILKGGWQETECMVCHWSLDESEDHEHNTGYTNGRNWLCTECYDKFMKPPDQPSPTPTST
ncbi:MAG TPA: Clp protease N-terminal domain-containing protein [Terriglobales bacterium]|jgi:hypothetical protein